MRHLTILVILLVTSTYFQQSINAQELFCGDNPDNFQGSAFMNYGGSTNSVNQDYRSAVVLGQPVVGTTIGPDNRSQFGFWNRYLLPPSAPLTTASQGEFPDRVQVSWIIDPLSPVTTNGFKIFRDGAFLVALADGISEFIDFNVQAGEYYEYKVIGYNNFGTGYPGFTVGFVNPNGVISGRITTNNGNPVIGATVSLTPTIGQSLSFDGTDDYVCIPYDASMYSSSFAVSAWIKIGTTHDQDGIIDYGSDLLNNWWIHTTASGLSKGVEIGVGNGASQSLTYEFPDDPDDWHHITASFDGATLILYVDGEFIDSRAASMTRDSTTVSIGRKRNGTGYFHGKIDDVRILDKTLSQGEIQQTMLRTLSSTADGIVAYWKLDEGIGEKIFDISAHKTHGTIYGASFNTENPSVLNSGVTDNAGFYLIEGIDYSQGGSFTATPAKNFYFNQALEFSASNQACAALTDFDLPDTSTVELVFNAFDIASNQVILSKGDGASVLFEVSLTNEEFFVEVDGDQRNLGAITKGYHHLAITLSQDGGALSAQIFLDGMDKGVFDFTSVSTDWTGENWLLGKSVNTASPRYYTGLIDEVVFFKNSLSQADIQLHASQGIEVADTNLVSYFNLNEGQGTDLLDMGPAMTGMGLINGALWSINVANPIITPHEFTPNTRQVNINSSNTAVGNIDFTDISTVAISGVVRYENTFCFAEGIEILVNGASYVPPIFTNVDGRFIADFEPGMDVILTPQFSDHNFLPAFFEVRKISAPVAGVLFQDLTKRTIVGQVAGGACRQSIIDVSNNTRVSVKISSSENSCYNRVIEFTNADGNYVFENVPPIPLTVAVIEHSDPTINTAFQDAGGQSIDLREILMDTVDFIYYSEPQVELAPFAVNSCGIPIMQQSGTYHQSIKVFQDYVGGKCYLDSADIRIVNDISDQPSIDTVMKDGELVFEFIAGGPNILSPYNKKIEVTATTADGAQANEQQDAFVLGKKANQTTFASASPQLPLFVLRDPPGDGSSSTLEKSTTTCNSVNYDIVSTEDNNLHVTYSYGPDLEIETGFFIAKSTVIDATIDVGIEATLSYTTGTTNGIETCVTTTEAFSTSDGDLIVGDQGGDLFVGVAYNFLYGTSNDLLYNQNTCSFELEKNLTVFPKNFETRFAYSEYHIKNVEIPRLEENDSLVSANRWRDILLRNEAQKANAVFTENFSFDAGAIFEKSLTSESTTSSSFTYEVENSAQIGLDLGLTIDGIGLVGGFSQTVTTSKSTETANSSLTGRTVSYTLADDDIGDNFTVNIKEDKVYATPVFQLISGKTMCPYETNTLNREEVSLSIDRNNAINIKSNDPAVFRLTVGNLSDEFKVYTVTPVPESNPDGAIVKISGSTAAMDLEVDAGGTVELTMTVFRGPTAYTYEDLAVAVFSACEDDRADFLGIDIDPRFYQEISYNVQYIEPCSEVDISFPLQNWVVTPAQDTQLSISISDYDLSDPDLELIRVQYRKIGGDGAWINITDLPKDSLGPIFENIVWDMSLLDDGPYEIRSLTQCFTTTLDPGISTVVQGRLETRPPMIFGTPQPADGILSANDEISVTFNEHIDCDAIFPADQNGNNNIGLYDATNGALIDATISCSNGKLFVVPNIQNKFIENRTLRVELDQIPDLSGNVTGHLQWEFLVDRNPLNWLGPDIVELMTVNEPYTVTRQIQNRGGSTAGFSIQNIPSWVTVEPNNININPGQIVVINFTFQDDLLIGDYQQGIELVGTEGTEPLDIRLMVRCVPPEWEFTDQALYENTMNFAIELDLFGDVSDDISDLIAAYINGEIRGLTNVQYVRELDKYLAFLTVYSDTPGEEIEIKVFDGDECIIYAEILEQFTFSSGDLIGSPLTPVVFHPVNIVERTIPMAQGWNWLSFNVDYGDNTLNQVLGSINNPEGVLIKDDNHFAQNLGGQWYGSLTDVSYKPRYLVKAVVDDTLTLRGTPYELNSAPINIETGWNWLGFVPQQGLSIETAFQTLTPLNGDIVKSQTAFAQFVAGSGWIGNLNFLEPGVGYLLNISNGGVLTYPEAVENFRDSQIKSGIKQIWKSNPFAYEHTMNMIAILDPNSNISLDEFDEIGVFVEGEIRGSAQPLYIESEDQHILFISINGSAEKQDLELRFYNDEEKVIYKVINRLNYQDNKLLGSVTDPIQLKLEKEGVPYKPTLDLSKEKSSLVLVTDVLNNIPDQVIIEGGAFDNVDLDFFLDDGAACAAYDYAYIISTGNDPAPGPCVIPKYQSSMTAFVKITFGDSLAFNSIGDHITLYNEQMQIVECITSAEDSFHPGERIFFLSVRGEVSNYNVKMEFYSAQYQRTFIIDAVFEYVQNANLGMPDSPVLIDVAPLNAQLNGADFGMSIQDDSWVGSQAVIINATDCTDDASGIDTVVYSVQQTGSPCTSPILLDVSIVQPSSASCLQSNPDGSIIINALLADSFSIDGGLIYSDQPLFTGLIDRMYSIMIKNTYGCFEQTQAILINDAYMSVTTEDATVNCIDQPTIALTAAVTVGQGPYVYEWRDGNNQIIDPVIGVEAGQYYLTITDARSCSDEDSLTVTLETDPLTWVLPGFLDGPVRVCAEEQDVLYVSGIDPLIGQFSWTHTDAGVVLNVQGIGEAVMLDFQSNSQNGYLKAEVSNLCSTVEDSVFVTINDIDILVQDEETDCFDNYLLNLEATAVNGNAPYSFEWKDDLDQTVDPLSGFHSGTYKVTLTDGDLCQVEEELVLVPLEDPLDGVTGDLIFGASLVCIDRPVDYIASYPASYGDIVWSASDVNVIIEPSGDGQTVTMNFGSEWTGYIYVTYINECSTVTDSMLVNLANEFICAKYSDCRAFVNVTDAQLNADLYPSEFKASETIQMGPRITDDHGFPLHPSYQFSAGIEINVGAGFEIQQGTEVILNIEDCISDN